MSPESIFGTGPRRAQRSDRSMRMNRVQAGGMAMWLGALLWAGSAGASGVVQQIDAHKHLGVASCASSTCHGSTQKFPESRVWQNEFAIWQESDPHARAYEILKKPESQKIARNLGLGDATKASVCLDCHASNTPMANRGEKFQIEDGVGCESCHGGSELWISSHAASTAVHADNVSRGLYPTPDPVARAKLCLTCHMGTSDRRITHEIMGAGHPRLGFELDTFTWLNPHYEIDADYIERKGQFNGARDWAVGQGVAAQNLLDQLRDPKTGWTGIFPELTLFDCHACHKQMKSGSWAKRPGTGLGPGVVRLNDSNLVIYKHVLNVVDPAAGRRLAQQITALHQATLVSQQATLKAAATLSETIESTLTTVAAYPFAADSLPKLIASIRADAERGEFVDYAAAEQGALAAQSIVVAFQTARQLDEAKSKQLDGLVDALTRSVDKDSDYQPQRFVAALRSLEGAAR
jgi:hypothetical protein